MAARYIDGSRTGGLRGCADLVPERPGIRRAGLSIMQPQVPRQRFFVCHHLASDIGHHPFVALNGCCTRHHLLHKLRMRPRRPCHIVMVKSQRFDVVVGPAITGMPDACQEPVDGIGILTLLRITFVQPTDFR